MIAHRVRICAADFMFSKLRANHLNALVRRTRTTRLVQGFSACPMSLTRHSSGHSSLAAQGRPRSERQLTNAQNPWENAYIPPPDEPVTGMKEVPAFVLEWEYAAAQEEARNASS